MIITLLLKKSLIAFSLSAPAPLVLFNLSCVVVVFTVGAPGFEVFPRVYFSIFLPKSFFSKLVVPFPLANVLDKVLLEDFAVEDLEVLPAFVLIVLLISFDASSSLIAGNSSFFSSFFSSMSLFSIVFFLL